MDSQILVSMIDLTLLSDDCNEEKVELLCEKTVASGVTAVCIYPKFVKQAKEQLQGSDIKVVTVCNFPSGTQSLEKTLLEISYVIEQGADEIDLVMPYKPYLSGGKEQVKWFVENCKAACLPSVPLKIILETGAFERSDLIYMAAKDMIEAGADFIKTSTGKIPMGATLSSVESILKAIRDMSVERAVGIKISGGIDSPENLNPYLELTKALMGEAWISPNTFRVGSSRLLDCLFSYP